MIDIDRVGQKKLDECLENLDSFDWNEWERKFLESNQSRTYENMSPRQKSMVTVLYDKLMEGS